MTLAQSNSKLIYDGGEASMYIRVDSKLNKLAVNTLRKGLGDSIKGDLKVIELTDVKHLSKIDYKRELMSVVVISEFPDNVKYMNSFMKNEAHQESFHVIFKCDTQ
jgi:DNA repair protein RadC